MSTTYMKRYQYDVARGVYRGYVDATAARARVQALIDRGFTATSIGLAAHVSHDTVTRVAAGTARLWQATARALENVTEAQVITATPTNGYVPRLGATRRVRALQRLGWNMPAIADHAGIKLRTVHSIVDPHQGDRTITHGTHDAIDKAYRALCMTVGPDARTARMGERRGWAAPLAWDDIDNPDEQPQHDVPENRAATVGELTDDVARLTRMGLSAAQIADHLGIARRTVVRHRRKVEVAA